MGRASVFFLVGLSLGLALLLSLLGLLTLPSNWLGWFLLGVGLLYFFGVIIVYWVGGLQFWRPRAGGEVVRQEQGDRSFWLIAAGLLAAFYLPPVEYLYLDTFLPRTTGMQILGLLLLLLGSILFLWAKRTLGKFYAGQLSVVEGQPLITYGPYRLIRHPAYAGYLLVVLGLAIGYSSALGLAMIVVLLMPALIYRIHMEEKVLSEHFGSQFHHYAGRTKRLLPYMW